ncbi:MAG: Do family serine endopeptidase, partial [Deltaproteobacteria bacterium]|nr:Do family serine endopeptidase [Deltaproteobacteria bacterium]
AVQAAPQAAAPVAPVAVAPPDSGKILAPLPSLAPMVKLTQPAGVNLFTVKVVRSRGGPSFPGRPPFPGPQGGPFNSPEEEFFNNFFGFPNQPPREYKERALGSGFIFDPAGYVITNNHVVEGADDIKVKLDDGQEIPATVIGKDTKTDIAVLKLSKEGTYPFIVFGDSDKVEIGDWLVAIGNPYGLEHTVTAGILSARGRAIGAGPYDDFLQTDASINPGNSGGPLLNLQGQVVGINTMIVAGGNGIGFAIPSSMATKIVDKLRTVGRVDRGWLGVYIQEVTPELAQGFGLDSPRGALIGTIQPNTPAEAAGFRHGDVVLTFDGKPIKQYQELSAFVADTEVGKVCQVVVWRDRKETTLSVTIGLLPDATQNLPGSGNNPQDLGLTVREITPDVARSLGLDPPQGLLIENVGQDSPAGQAGVRPRDVVLEIDNVRMNSMTDYQKALTDHKKDTPYVFFVKRGEHNLYISFNVN